MDSTQIKIAHLEHGTVKDSALEQTTAPQQAFSSENAPTYERVPAGERAAAPDQAPDPAEQFGLANAQKACEFHKSFPDYAITPLASLDALAQKLGVARIWVKDESYRFGLNAFKVLGGSYAIGRYLAGQLGKDISELPYETLISPQTKEELGDITFIAATDGNHGRGVAWTAQQLRQKSVIYMPKGSSPERLTNIQALGSDAQITDLNYDDAVRLANTHAEEHGWVVVQDTSWENYEEIPGWIMEGYTTMALEASKQILHNFPGEKPTHLFLQAGVGAMAGAVTGFFSQLYGKDRPRIIIVEPNNADCLYQTAHANDGELHFVTGDLDSIMAGLCCGEPCSIGWNVLKDHADYFVSVPDEIAEKGMRLLGKPLGSDPRVISGESGAVTTGFVAELLENPELAWFKEELGLDENSHVLCFSTEGDTDKENYQKILSQ
ncbi:MAG: diaminopropionate ammonia-lyase [Anaerotardibacter sp.]